MMIWLYISVTNVSHVYDTIKTMKYVWQHIFV